MDKFLYYAVTLVEAALGVFGIRGLYEQPRYAVVERLDRGVEIRFYEERIAVETDMRSKGDGEAFGRLFRYITGANRGGERIAMTTPVENGGRRIAMTVPVEEGAGGTMRFFLPRDVALAGAPVLTENDVRLVRVPAGRMAVLRFTGSVKPEIRVDRERTLSEVLSAASRKAEGPIILMSYDPPFSIPFLRRNEVAVGIAPPVSPIVPSTVLPPIVADQKEVGIKYDFGPVGASLALFEINRPNAVLNPVTLAFMADGLQRNRGIEFNVFGEPVPGIRLLGGVAAIEGSLVKTAGGAFDGKVAPGVPALTLNLYGEYDLPPWLLTGLTATGRVIYTSRQFYDQGNTQSIPDWTRFDVGLRYTFLGSWGNTPLTARLLKPAPARSLERASVLLPRPSRRPAEGHLARRPGRMPVHEEVGTGALPVAEPGRRRGDDLIGADGLPALGHRTGRSCLASSPSSCRPG